MTSSNVSDDNFDFEIEIKDTGIGIEEHGLNLIFESFRQLNSRDDKVYEGTGLGLAITKNLVSILNGNIRVESRIGQGSSFFVSFKKVIFNNDKTKQKNEYTWDYGSADFDESYLLIVDDIEANRELVKSYLHDYPKIKIFEAVNGEDALTLSNITKFDAILMDLRMPVIDGYQATKLIRETKLNSSTPIIAFTASSMQTDSATIQDTFDGFLRKPITKLDLLKQLCDFLSKKSKNVHKSINPESTYDNISDSDLSNIDSINKNSFISFFDKNIKSSLNDLQDAIDFDQLDNFIKVFEEYVLQNNIPHFPEILISLKKSAASFSFDDIQNNLNKISKLTKTLKESSND